MNIVRNAQEEPVCPETDLVNVFNLSQRQRKGGEEATNCRHRQSREQASERTGSTSCCTRTLRFQFLPPCPRSHSRSWVHFFLLSVAEKYTRLCALQSVCKRFQTFFFAPARKSKCFNGEIARAL